MFRNLAPDEKPDLVHEIPFFLTHLAAIVGLVLVDMPAAMIWLTLALFWGRMFFVTAGYHRYFSHRSFKTSRAGQFILALGAITTAQKGPLWWAAHHRHHHRYSDTADDVHPPLKGFWWAHIGWILAPKWKATDIESVKDFAKFGELRFLNRHYWIGPVGLGAICTVAFGLPGLVAFLVSTVLLWHATFVINSLTHRIGRRRYATTDTSRNSAILAIITMGEGWHNNHHYYQASVRQGFYWWEWDPTYYILKVLSWLHLVSDLKVPNEKIRTANRIDQGAFDVGMFTYELDAAEQTVSATQTTANEGLRASIEKVKAAAADLAAEQRRSARNAAVA